MKGYDLALESLLLSKSFICFVSLKLEPNMMHQSCIAQFLLAHGYSSFLFNYFLMLTTKSHRVLRLAPACAGLFQLAPACSGLFRLA